MSGNGAIKKVETEPAEFVIAAPDALATRQPDMTPVDLLRIAIEKNADIEKVTKFVEWYEKREAKKAFEAAMKQFKADPPVISKNKKVHYPTKAGGFVDYRHATLDHLCEEVMPALSAVGITHGWKVTQEKEFITVICVLTGFGHSEETQMTGLPDTSGDKSPLKALSATVTHLQRYTLFSALGLAASNDDETERNGEPFIEAEEIEKACGEISRASDIPTLKFLFGAALNKARELGDKKAMAHYITANDKRKKELEHAPR